MSERDQSGAEGGAAREGRHLRRLLLGLRVLARLRPSDRQAVFLWAAAVGFLGASAALAFKAATEAIQWLLTGHRGGHVAVFTTLDPLHRLAVPAVGALCAGLVLMLGRRFVRAKATDYMEAVALGDGIVPVRPSLVRSASAMFSIASGEAIGREGPLVQLAAMAASGLGRLRRMAPARRRLLVACGAAAGISTAYHTPLGGAIFVAEIVLGSMAMEGLGPLLISSVVAVLTVQSVEGSAPLYPFEGFSLTNPAEIVLYALLGVGCGIAARWWMRLLQATKTRFGSLPVAPWARLTLGGLIVGLLAMWHPEVTGNGASLIRGLLGGDFVGELLLLLLVLKIGATAAAFGSGAVGGVFTPSLFIGAVGGLLFATLAATVWPWGELNVGGFALVGMGGFLAAAAQAPVTALLMVFEMTLHYEIVLPLMVAVVSAHFTARSVGADSLYGESLRAGPRSVFDRPLGDVTVGVLMRPEPPRVTLGARFGEIAATFLRSPGRELWVTDHADALRGAILLPEVEPYFKVPDLAGAVIAADILREDVVRLRPDQGLSEALAAFSRSDYETVPVVAESGRLLGTVGRADLFFTVSELARREGNRHG